MRFYSTEQGPRQQRVAYWSAVAAMTKVALLGVRAPHQGLRADTTA